MVCQFKHYHSSKISDQALHCWTEETSRVRNRSESNFSQESSQPKKKKTRRREKKHLKTKASQLQTDVNAGPPPQANAPTSSTAPAALVMHAAPATPTTPVAPAEPIERGPRDQSSQRAFQKFEAPARPNTERYQKMQAVMTDVDMANLPRTKASYVGKRHNPVKEGCFEDTSSSMPCSDSNAGSKGPSIDIVPIDSCEMVKNLCANGYKYVERTE